MAKKHSNESLLEKPLWSEGVQDDDYWKNQYKQTWGQSSEREKTIAKSLMQATGKTIEPVGLGAGSAEFLSGAASAHGHAKGDADLIVEGTNIYLEVTGPLVKFVDENQNLWVRPDKIINAKQNITSHETWVLHHLPKNDLVRVVPLDCEFWRALDAGDFPVVTPTIRGAKERYHAIPATHSCVKAFSVLIDRLKKI
jgi:hypothetical protein